MDDQKVHDDDDSQDSDAELENTVTDDTDDTDEDTDGEPQKKVDAKEVADKQEKSWLDKIKSGEKKLEDMPENLGWLKKRVEKKLEPEKKEVNEDEITSKIRATLLEERAEEEFNYLVDDLKSAKITSEQEAQLKEEYEDYLSGFDNPTPSRKLKALIFARRMVGLKNSTEIVRERKVRGMTLPSYTGRNRSVPKRDEMTDIEKRLSGDLPPGFKA